MEESAIFTIDYYLYLENRRTKHNTRYKYWITMDQIVDILALIIQNKLCNTNEKLFKESYDIHFIFIKYPVHIY